MCVRAQVRFYIDKLPLGRIDLGGKIPTLGGGGGKGLLINGNFPLKHTRCPKKKGDVGSRAILGP